MFAVRRIAVACLLTSIGSIAARAQEVELQPAGPASLPDVYLIQPGDTLWDISSAFLGDSSYWPRLWSINSYITNPHWIYPGNRIVFHAGTVIEPPKIELEPQSPTGDGYVVASMEFQSAEVECGPDIHFDWKLPSTRYTAPGFLADKSEVEVYGELFAAKTGMLGLGEGDLVYLRMEDVDAVQCGDVFAIFRRGPKVRHPDSRRIRYGNMYRIVGEARVVHTEGDVATAVIRTMYSHARRGDLVGPLVPVTAELPVAAPKGDMEGTIVARLDQDLRSLAADGETVFVDRGRDDGLRVGNTFWVITRLDPGQDLHREDPDIPAQVVGRVVITRVEPDSSTGVVVDAAAPVRVGAHLVMHLD